MANTFPNLVPDYVQIMLPDYVKNIQEFNTSDFYQTNLQTQPIGYKLEFKYTNLVKTNSDILRNFYHQQKHKSFKLPTNFLATRFPTNTLVNLPFYEFWEFSGTIQVNPKIVNKNFFRSEVTFALENLVS